MEEQPTDAATIGAGLSAIRKRRLYLWGVILVYLPAMWTLLRFKATFRTLATAFGIWLFLLIVVALVSAVARCPRCGNYFHMQGATLLYLRKCLHCQLHVCADKKDPTPG